MATARRSGTAPEPAWAPCRAAAKPPPRLALLALLVLPVLLVLPGAPASAALPPAGFRADLRTAPLVASTQGAAQSTDEPTTNGEDGTPPADPAAEPDAAADTTDPYADAPYADDLYADEEEDADAEEDGDPYAADLALEEPDPYEDFNRTLFGFNQRADRLVIEPIARAYGWVMPDVAERAVLRFFANLNSPSILVNDLLQLECRRAGVTLTRFVVNTTVGVGGLLDVADSLGLEGHHADFGQTLAVAGVPSGPYLVLPMAGPSTARDAFGSVVDLAFRPHTYFLGPTVVLLVGGGSGIVTREAYHDELEALRESSVDFYATMRNIYFQRRAEQLRERGVEMEAVKKEEEPAAEEALGGSAREGEEEQQNLGGEGPTEGATSDDIEGDRRAGEADTPAEGQRERQEDGR